jgi:Enoyl-(Acyl carrier protein) reductase
VNSRPRGTSRRTSDARTPRAPPGRPPGRSAYATAKSAQAGLARAWARELTPFGVTVNTVAPGFIPVQRHAGVPDDARQAYLASVPAGRLGTPGDIAHAVSFLASEGAGFITGQRILIDDGRHLGRCPPAPPTVTKHHGNSQERDKPCYTRRYGNFWTALQVPLWTPITGLSVRIVDSSRDLGESAS